MIRATSRRTPASPSGPSRHCRSGEWPGLEVMDCGSTTVPAAATLISSPDGEARGTSVRLPENLHAAAALASKLDLAPSTSEMTVAGLRGVLEGIAQQTVLEQHYLDHPELRSSLAQGRKTRGQTTDAVVPSTVRIEADWDRRDSGAAVINRFPVRDAHLDSESIDFAAQIHGTLEVSVPGSHLGAVMQRATRPLTLLSARPKRSDTGRLASISTKALAGRSSPDAVSGTRTC